MIKILRQYCLISLTERDLFILQEILLTIYLNAYVLEVEKVQDQIIRNISFLIKEKKSCKKN
jgi:hypothetical protein